METAKEILSKYKNDTDHFADQDYDERKILEAMEEYANQFKSPIQNAEVREWNKDKVIKLLEDIKHSFDNTNDSDWWYMSKVDEFISEIKDAVK